MSPEPRNNGRWVGRARLRVEDDRLVRGQGRFVGDLTPPGCLHVAFARSPYAHGRIEAVEIEEAAAMPGVVAVYTGADVAGLGELPVNKLVETLRVPRFPILASDRVMAVGEPVAAVVAETLAEAIDAAETIFIDCGPQAAVTSSAPGQDPLFEEVPDNRAVAQDWRAGDPEAAFAAADVVVHAAIRHPRVAPASLEPRVALADWADDGLTVWLPSQAPHRARTDLADIVGLEESRVRVVAPDVGGAFGMKASVYPEDALVAFAAARLKRPVKWQASRADDLLAGTHGRGIATEGELALTSDGTMLGLRAQVTAPLGHWLPFSAAVPARNAARILPGPYEVEAVEISARAYVTTTAPVGIYRGAGRPEAAMLMERLVDKAAAALDLDAVELRRRNLVRADRFPHLTPTGETLDSGDYQGTLDKAVEVARLDELRADVEARRAGGELVGLGLAFYIEPSGQGWESARVRLEPDARVTAATGSCAQGQGRETATQQIVADVLRLPPESVAVLHGDTATSPKGIGALASRSTPIGGGALVRAAEEVRDRAGMVAGELLQTDPGELVLIEGGFAPKGSCEVRAGWPAIAERAANGAGSGGGSGAIEADVIFESPGEAWGYGACVALVSIDRETGVPTVERVVWIDDAGEVVNPTLVEGQLMGGIAQGLGEALMERIVYDEDGQLLTGSLMDYALPRAADMPAMEFGRTITPSPLNPLGAKGVGEAGTIGAPPAVIGAALDALAPLGVTELDMPLTGETIWRAMEAAKERKA